MTYKETILAIRGYENRQLRDWERTRLIAYQVYTSIPKKGANKPITHYLPLASDLRNRSGKAAEDMVDFRKRLIEKQKLKQVKPNISPN